MNPAPPVNTATPPPQDQPAQPAAPSIPCNPKCEMRFQFDQYGTPGLHAFLLHWDFADGNLQYIEVLVADTQEVIQKIDIPQDKTHLIYNELSDKPERIRDKFIDSLDYDFNKSGDLRLTQRWPYLPGDKYYFVWLFDEQKNQYVLNDAITALQNPQPNPRTKRIESATVGGWAGGEYTRRVYEISPTGTLRVQAKITQTMLDPKPLTFLRDVRVRLNGELQRVCKIRVPAEGKARKLWGARDVCDKYMTKETPRR
jgi:hypothetical protein